MEIDHFFIEFLPRIQTAHICISTSSSQLTFSSNQILRPGQKEECWVLRSWEDPQLISSSHQGLKLVQGEGVHIRFKTVSQGSLEGGKLPLYDKLADYGCKDCQLSIKCSFCGAQFVRGQ